MTAATDANKQQGGVAVTVSCSAPELFKDKPKSFASDVYTLAVTLWEIYERRIPFDNMPEAAVVNQVIAGTRPEIAVKDMPMVKKIISVCMSADLKDRPNADQVDWNLSEVLAKLRLQPLPSSHYCRPFRWGHPHRRSRRDQGNFSRIATS